MCLDWAGSISDTRVGSPVVVASSLLAGTEVTVRALIHFLCLVFLLHGASRWVEDILGRDTVAGWYAKCVLALLLSYLLWPIVYTLVALTEGLTNGGGILAFLDVIEFVSEAIQILSFNHDIDWVSMGGCTSEIVTLRQARLTFLEARMYHDLTWVHIVRLSELSDVRWCANIATVLVSVHLLSDGHISVMTTGGYYVTGCAYFGDGILANLSGGGGLACGSIHL